ncbi:hypothetical protein PN36_12670 [Candidatus Thiomargarita nelsonii]|uniref:Uncharacterized protein n=1 Tax=Candidatus Thiomargarita nelsonii TaxID=1003181 RepID=A0A0A6RY01_9GAMM|nr:hypothetical protein PN36_12670 [Candidatus Thiomargarita nelsonii]
MCPKLKLWTPKSPIIHGSVLIFWYFGVQSFSFGCMCPKLKLWTPKDALTFQKKEVSNDTNKI